MSEYRGRSNPWAPRCTYCSEPILNVDRAYHAIEGWELPRRGGGANQVTLRRVSQPVAYACISCISARRHGVPVEQESLL